MIHPFRVTHSGADRTRSPHFIRERLPRGASECLSSTGRGAITHLIRRLSLDTGSSVLMPAYVAEGVLRPFLAAGVRVRFYRLGPALAPDRESVESLLASDPGVRLMVVVHPFGFEVPVSPFRELLARKGAYLLEDCAHALFGAYASGGGFGSRGDFALYSYNKFLPVPDGALLVSHRPEVDVSAEGFAPADKPAIDFYLEHLRLNQRLLDEPEPRRAKQLLEQTGSAYDRYYERINGDPRPRAMSDESQRILPELDLDGLVSARRRNARLLYDFFADSGYEPAFPACPENTVPQCVPALVEAGHRDELVTRALDRGAFLGPLIGRWNFLPNRDEFVHEARFIERHVLIPVSEFITEPQLLQLIEILKGVKL